MFAPIVIDICVLCLLCRQWTRVDSRLSGLYVCMCASSILKQSTVKWQMAYRVWPNCASLASLWGTGCRPVCGSGRVANRLAEKLGSVICFGCEGNLHRHSNTYGIHSLVEKNHSWTEWDFLINNFYQTKWETHWNREFCYSFLRIPSVTTENRLTIFLSKAKKKKRI